MSDITILNQPRACQPADGEFLHAPSFAWYVRAVAGVGHYADVLESDTQLDSLELFGEDTWKVLATSNLFRQPNLALVREQLAQADGSTCFYPVARLRPSSAPALLHPTSYSPVEQAHANDQLLTALANDRFQVTRAARRYLGSGDRDDLGVTDLTSTLELLELELSDSSLLLGWGWVWYRT